MEVNTCDYALCIKCYTKLLLSDESDTGLGGGTLGICRRSSGIRNATKVWEGEYAYIVLQTLVV